ncbi:MAG: cytochrome c biogenesis protein CcsA [Bacteroidales bacterium]|nr:cytochrome c biogenesis protein CcsA [Bacteroidales bacterium]
MKTNFAFWFTHIGLFLTLLFFIFGRLSYQELHVRAFSEIAEDVAISDKHDLFQLPFQITLKNFEAEFYDNHQPKSYKADIILKNKDSEKHHLLQVNHPARFMNYGIYLSSYDQTNPNRPDYVILLIVYDVVMYGKYMAIMMFLIGLLLYVWQLPFAKNRLISLVVLLFGLGFSMIPFGPYLWGTKNLVPALQSWWFMPHIAVYMFAYGALSVACLLAIYTIVARSRSATPTIQKSIDFSLKLGTFLMGIGLIFGMLWAKTAWGRFWGFDIKETWALIAWVAFLSVLHFNYVYGKHRKTLSILIITAFVLLQICWFGINYFPESWKSLHRY